MACTCDSSKGYTSESRSREAVLTFLIVIISNGLSVNREHEEMKSVAEIEDCSSSMSELEQKLTAQFTELAMQCAASDLIRDDTAGRRQGSCISVQVSNELHVLYTARVAAP